MADQAQPAAATPQKQKSFGSRVLDRLEKCVPDSPAETRKYLLWLVFGGIIAVALANCLGAQADRIRNGPPALQTQETQQMLNDRAAGQVASPAPASTAATPAASATAPTQSCMEQQPQPAKVYRRDSPNKATQIDIPVGCEIDGTRVEPVPGAPGSNYELDCIDQAGTTHPWMAWVDGSLTNVSQGACEHMKGALAYLTSDPGSLSDGETITFRFCSPNDSQCLRH